MSTFFTVANYVVGETEPVTKLVGCPERTSLGLWPEAHSTVPSASELRSSSEVKRIDRVATLTACAYSLQAFSGAVSVLRVTTQRATRAAAKPDEAPMPSAQRAPKWFATQPTIGAPIGVPPSAIPTRSAITLPRIEGSVESCIMLFVELVNVKAATPITTRAPANHQYPGANAASVHPIPKTTEPISREPN